MTTVSIENNLTSRYPGMAFGILTCQVRNTQYNNILWKEIEETIQAIRNDHNTDSIKRIPNIAATRDVYKALGKDPSRYRPSAEALFRRVVKENDLYKINTLVDFINLISLNTGYSIGGFDMDKVNGKVVLGIGEANEPFEAIGRGVFNIEGLPVLRDSTGAFGTPTSDSLRTAITLDTKNFFMLVYGFSGEKKLNNEIAGITQVIKKFIYTNNIAWQIFG